MKLFYVTITSPIGESRDIALVEREGEFAVVEPSRFVLTHTAKISAADFEDYLTRDDYANLKFKLAMLPTGTPGEPQVTIINYLNSALLKSHQAVPVEVE